MAKLNTLILHYDCYEIVNTKGTKFYTQDIIIKEEHRYKNIQL